MSSTNNVYLYYSCQGKTKFALQNFSKGIPSSTLIESETVNKPHKGLSIAYGRKTIENIMKYSVKNNLPILFIDNPYFGKVKYRSSEEEEIYYRIAYGHPHTKLENFKQSKFKSNRFDKLNIQLNNYSKDGDYILVCPPTNYICDIYNLGYDWLERTLKNIRKNTNRKIVVGPKPKILDKFRDEMEEKIKNIDNVKLSDNKYLKTDLENAWMIIAPSSVALIEGLIYGKPIITESFSPVCDISNNFENIENPIYFNREKTFYRLAYCQYNIKEMNTGIAWETINNVYNMEY